MQNIRLMKTVTTTKLIGDDGILDAIREMDQGTKISIHPNGFLLPVEVERYGNSWEADIHGGYFEVDGSNNFKIAEDVHRAILSYWRENGVDI